MPSLRPNLEANDAIKVDALCARILGDIGSVYMRAFSSGGYPPELVALRRWVRDTQDSVREAYPTAFFK